MKVVSLRGGQVRQKSQLAALTTVVWGAMKMTLMVIPRPSEHKDSLFNCLRVVVFLDFVDRDNTK